MYYEYMTNFFSFFFYIRFLLPTYRKKKKKKRKIFREHIAFVQRVTNSINCDLTSSLNFNFNLEIEEKD